MKEKLRAFVCFFSLDGALLCGSVFTTGKGGKDALLPVLKLPPNRKLQLTYN